LADIEDCLSPSSSAKMGTELITNNIDKIKMLGLKKKTKEELLMKKIALR